MKMLSKALCILWILRLCFLYASSSGSIAPISTKASSAASAAS